MSTINAKLVAAGVGLPGVWREDDLLPGRPTYCGADEVQTGPIFRIPNSVDLSDYQTRAGLLRQLAIWAGDDGEGQAYWLHLCEYEGVWSLRNDRNSTSTVVEFDTLDRVEEDRIPFHSSHLVEHKALWLAGVLDETEALAAILVHIGRDAAVRRALGWKVEAGTLATLEVWGAPGYWLLKSGGQSWLFSPHGNPGEDDPVNNHTRVTALDGITDPTQALTAIYEELARG